MADSTILKQIVWPHKLEYGPGVKPTMYDEQSLPLFIQGFLVILEAERPQLKEAMLKHPGELMKDAAIYG